MYQKTITGREAGQRLDKYLHKLLPEAQSSFLYKMLRKKNIVLNDKKADGSEKIACGDVISVYFSDETLQKFMGGSPTAQTHTRTGQSYGICMPFKDSVSVIYENEHLLIADKPAGVLTQKADASDVSLNDWLIARLLTNGEITQEDLRTFRPSACNRLDRNTSGLVLCAKSVAGAQMLSDALRIRSLHKFYRLYAKGHIDAEETIEGFLQKDAKTNTVRISKTESADAKESFIQTRYLPIRQEKDKTLLEVELITGKSHQIRAHLASIAHPLLGDYKYGDRAWNDTYKKAYGVTHQLLHAYKIVFPHLDAPFTDISGMTFYAPLPAVFETVSDPFVPS